jgi:hypothetical protein
MGETADQRIDLALGIAEQANRNLQAGSSRGDAALESRDRFVIGALQGGTSVAEIAEALGLTEQAVYQIRDRVERGGPAIAHESATITALERLTDHHAFEEAAVRLLQDLDPSLRSTGGPGDRARDAVGGIAGQRGDALIVMVSLEIKWAQKVRRELDRIARHGWEPKEVWAVTNRRTTPRSRDRLIDEAGERGWELRIFDQTWLVNRLLLPEHLELGQSLLGLAPPQPPAFLDPTEYRALIARRGPMWPGFLGRDGDMDSLRDMIDAHQLVVVCGSGGIGKTRLVLELARQHSGRWMFVDDRAPVEPRSINEIAGNDECVVVIDNAHRRDDLHQLIGLLERRHGELRVVLIARPGYEEQLTNAVADTRVGPLRPDVFFALKPLGPKHIAHLLRAEPLSLAYSGAVDAIVRLSEGNPQIALLAGQLSKGGTPVEAMGRDEMLQSYVASLLASVTSTVGGDTRVFRETLSLAAALNGIPQDDEELMSVVAELLEVSRRGLIRILADLADAGLLTEEHRQFVVTPDVLAEHVLWAAFFSSRWRPTIAYSEVWKAASPRYRVKLVSALGRLPAAVMPDELAELRIPREDLIASAKEASGVAIVQMSRLIRELARGVPKLAAELVDILLDRLPSDERRTDVLLSVCDAMERVGDLSVGWPRQLRIGEEAFAEPAEPKVEEAVTKALASVYQRVPIDTGERDGIILAAVQRTLAQATTEYWTNHRGEPGVAQCVALASRTLLTVTYHRHFSPADNPKSIVMMSCALPASSHTDAVLTAGGRLFCETFGELPMQLQLKQLEVVATLRRTVAKGSGWQDIEVSPEMVSTAAATLRQIQRCLAAEFSNFALPVRAEAADILTDGPVPAPSDPTLAEYMLIVQHRSLRRRRRHEIEDFRQALTADAFAVLRLLHDADSATARLDAWAIWLEETRTAQGRGTTSPVIGMALELAAKDDQAQTAAWIEHVIDRESPLVQTVVPAVAVIFGTDGVGERFIKQWTEHPSPEVRSLAAGALPGVPGNRPHLERLAADDSPLVRAAVLDGMRWAPTLDSWRIDVALQAAQDGDTTAVDFVLALLERTTDDGRLAAPLSTQQLARISQLVLASATSQRVENDYELTHIFSRLSPNCPDLPYEWIVARIEALAQRDSELQNADPDTYLTEHFDPLPATVLEALAQNPKPSYLRNALDQLDTLPTNSIRFTELTSVVAALDQGFEVVTDQLGDWLERDGEGDAWRVYKLLETPLAWDVFTDRSRSLLSRVNDPRLVAMLVEVRDPKSWAGSVVPLYEQLRDGYGKWAADSDARLAAAGAEGVSRFERLISREREREESEDDDWRWLRPATRVT